MYNPLDSQNLPDNDKTGYLYSAAAFDTREHAPKVAPVQHHNWEYHSVRSGLKFDANFTSIENVVRNCATRSHLLKEDGTLADPVINTIVVGHATFNKEKPGDLSSTLKTFTAPRGISAHYVVHHEADKDGFQVFQLVDHGYRAWYGGASAWGKSLGTVVNYDETGIRKESKQISINDNGIGVWLVAKEATLTEYTPSQINAAANLINSLMTTYDIHPLDVTGYHDVALCRVYRAIEIGLPLNVTLPWPELFKLTPGLSVINNVLEENANTPFHTKFNVYGSEESDTRVKNVQALLHEIGYAVEPTGWLDDVSYCAIHAFNMHFNQAEFDKDIMDGSGWVDTWTDKAQHIAEDLAALRDEKALIEPMLEVQDEL